MGLAPGRALGWMVASLLVCAPPLFFGTRGLIGARTDSNDARAARLHRPGDPQGIHGPNARRSETGGREACFPIPAVSASLAAMADLALQGLTRQRIPRRLLTIPFA